MSLRRFFRRRYWDDERARELDVYLAQEIDDNLARGMSAGEARAAAHRRLGNPTRIREEIYDFNTIGWFDTLRLDLRDALRQLRRRRQVAATTILLLTIGIGAATAAVAVAYGTLLRPLSYPDPDRLLTLWQYSEGALHQISAPDARDLTAMPAIERAALLWSGRSTLMAGVEVDRVTTIEAEAPLLPMLGARALLGRLTGAADADQPVAVISRRLWRGVFQGDPAIVGRVVQLGGDPCTIVGVLDDLDFELPVGGLTQGPAFTVKDVDLWRTFGARADVPNTRQVFTFEAVVKLRPGARLEQAQAAADTIAANLARQYPDTNRGRGFRFVPLQQQIVDARAAAIWIGLAGALLILVIACVNAVSLALGELPARRRDFALREALGAGRARLLRQVALESGNRRRDRRPGRLRRGLAAAARLDDVDRAAARAGRQARRAGRHLLCDLRVRRVAHRQAVADAPARRRRRRPPLGLVGARGDGAAAASCTGGVADCDGARTLGDGRALRSQPAARPAGVAGFCRRARPVRPRLRRLLRATRRRPTSRTSTPISSPVSRRCPG